MDHLWNAAAFARDAADAASRAIQATLKGDTECPPTSARLETEDAARASYACAEAAVFAYSKYANTAPTTTETEGDRLAVSRAVLTALAAAHTALEFHDALYRRPEGRRPRAWRAYARYALEEGVEPAVKAAEQAVEALLRYPKG